LKEVSPVHVKASLENGKEFAKCLEMSLAGGVAPCYLKPAPENYEEWCACLRSVAMKGASLEKMR
jgi:hypothetical protein